MRCAPLLVFVLVLPALIGCTPGPIPRDELALQITTDAYEVPLATAFVVTVARSWSKHLQPEEWSDETLSPLLVRLEDVDRRESDDRVLETRRFRAIAVELGDVRVLPPLFVATPQGGGDEVVVTGDPLDLRVTSVLPAGDTSGVELPGGMQPRRFPWREELVGAGAAVLLALLVHRARRRAVAPAVPEEPVGPPPEQPAAIALRALDAAAARGAEPDPRPLHDAVSDALREYVRARFAVGTPEFTNEELLAAAHSVSLPQYDALRAVLRSCAMVRFARSRSDAEACARVVDDARAFVHATAGEGAT